MNLIIVVICGLLIFGMLLSDIKAWRAMYKAPKGKKIEAYYTSIKGYNPFGADDAR